MDDIHEQARKARIPKQYKKKQISAPLKSSGSNSLKNEHVDETKILTNGCGTFIKGNYLKFNNEFIKIKDILDNYSEPISRLKDMRESIDISQKLAKVILNYCYHHKKQFQKNIGMLLRDKYIDLCRLLENAKLNSLSRISYRFCIDCNHLGGVIESNDTWSQHKAYLQKNSLSEIKASDLSFIEISQDEIESYEFFSETPQLENKIKGDKEDVSSDHVDELTENIDLPEKKKSVKTSDAKQTAKTSKNDSNMRKNTGSKIRSNNPDDTRLIDFLKGYDIHDA
jgi:hypothetical protein